VLWVPVRGQRKIWPVQRRGRSSMRQGPPSPFLRVQGQVQQRQQQQVRVRWPRKLWKKGSPSTSPQQPRAETEPRRQRKRTRRQLGTPQRQQWGVQRLPQYSIVLLLLPASAVVVCVVMPVAAPPPLPWPVPVPPHRGCAGISSVHRASRHPPTQTCIATDCRVDDDRSCRWRQRLQVDWLQGCCWQQGSWLPLQLPQGGCGTRWLQRRSSATVGQGRQRDKHGG
jgi:hypothetical protein